MFWAQGRDVDLHVVHLLQFWLTLTDIRVLKFTDIRVLKPCGAADTVSYLAAVAL